MVPNSSLGSFAICFKYGIKHATTFPYHPQPSHAERFNRNLRSALIAYHAEEQNKWDQNLQWLQMAFNSALHESHKAVPFEVMFGFSPVHQLGNLWRVEELLPDCPDGRIANRWKEVTRNLRRSHEHVRSRYNKGRSPNPFKVGQLVYCRSHPLSSKVDSRAAKLCYRWIGPLRIDEFVSPVTARLVRPSDGTQVRVAHISHLKGCFHQ